MAESIIRGTGIIGGQSLRVNVGAVGYLLTHVEITKDY